ncbi:MAG: hypothetical protein K2X82_28640 [Gemmataceae bacterium]|nr:hypothetical protein [Gemmataceae bacterium]
MADELSRGGPALALLVALALLAAGCGQTANSGSDTKDKPVAKITPGKADGDGKAEDKGDHSGWWCDEHALPEAVCDLCSKKYRESEKAKGNWCEHGRVKSSCFKCNPGLKEKYAAEYVAKFGKEPPAAEDDETKDDGKAKK